jgi:CRP/FNR family cyclic AMP-dependent transcriptional regulator
VPPFPELPASAHGRPLSDAPALAQLAADLLRTPTALLNLNAEESACVVAQMRLVSFGPGVTLFREGDATRLDYMLLVLDGEVSVDVATNGQPGPVAISVVGPGNVIGELALLDGAPRSASCVTATAVHAAGLSRRGLEQLIEQRPQVAAKLLVGLNARTADRLRALGEQLQIYARLVAQQQAEIVRLRR